MIKINKLKRGYASQTDTFCKKGTYLHSPYFRIKLMAEVSGMLWDGLFFSVVTGFYLCLSELSQSEFIKD